MSPEELNAMYAMPAAQSGPEASQYAYEHQSQAGLYETEQPVNWDGMGVHEEHYAADPQHAQAAAQAQQEQAQQAAYAQQQAFRQQMSARRQQQPHPVEPDAAEFRQQAQSQQQAPMPPWVPQRPQLPQPPWTPPHPASLDYMELQRREEQRRQLELARRHAAMNRPQPASARNAFLTGVAVGAGVLLATQIFRRWWNK